MSDVRHPIAEQIERMFGRKAIALARCVKACFRDADDKETTLEGQRVIADLRKFAYLNGHKQHSFLRDLTGAIDPLSMARIEGRREVVNRLTDFLELDPEVVARFMEVDNES